VVCLRLCDSNDRELYRAHLYTLGIFCLDFESPLTTRQHTDVSVIKFLSLSPFQGNALMLACMYRLMPIAYELVVCGWDDTPNQHVHAHTYKQTTPRPPPTHSRRALYLRAHLDSPIGMGIAEITTELDLGWVERAISPAAESQICRPLHKIRKRRKAPTQLVKTLSVSHKTTSTRKAVVATPSKGK